MSLDVFLPSNKKKEAKQISEEEKKLAELNIKFLCPQSFKPVKIEECLVCPVRNRCWGAPIDIVKIYLSKRFEQQRESRRGLRTSSIAGCVYRQYMDEKEIIIDPRSMASVIKGEVFHIGLAEYFKGESDKQFEKRIEAEIDGVWGSWTNLDKLGQIYPTSP